MPRKTPAANRHHGGPGSSHQREDLPDPTEAKASLTDQRHEEAISRVSGGGGERDTHHTHDARMKGGRVKDSAHRAK